MASSRLRIGTVEWRLLLTWTAWQVGSGYCTTLADALAHLRSCPQGSDPLEFIVSDLLARFTPEQERIVATLIYPTEPIPVTAIAEISGVDETTTRRALKLLTNRLCIFCHALRSGGSKVVLSFSSHSLGSCGR